MSKIFINENPTITVKLKKDHRDTNAERKFKQLYDEQLKKLQKVKKELLSPEKQPVLSNQKRSSKKI